MKSTRAYVVQDGENDWIIAHRIGTTTLALKRANPGVNLSRLHEGQKIRLPITAVARSVNRIATRYAVIDGDNVNVRRGPGSSAEQVVQVDSGTRVLVLDRDGEWYRLRFPHGTEGWVRGGLLKPVSVPRDRRRHEYLAEASRTHSASHRDEYADRVASGAHKSGAPSSVAHNSGAPKPPSGSGRPGKALPWVAEDFSDNGDTSGKIIEAASRFRGVRYRWGAMSRSATDCSGFTSQVFKNNGFTLPRTAQQQSETGLTVHSKDLKAGDLVFFHTVRGSRVSHVGIYIGHGKFIHASSAGGHVQVNSLSDGYYEHRLVGARRMAKKVEVASKPAPKSIAQSETVKVQEPADAAEEPTPLSTIGK